MSRTDDLQIGQDVPIMDVATDFQEHYWKQYGNELVCEGGCSVVASSNASRHGTRITDGVMLTGAPGNWKLTVRQGNVQDHESYTLARRKAEEIRQEIENAK